MINSHTLNRQIDPASQSEKPFKSSANGAIDLQAITKQSGKLVLLDAVNQPQVRGSNADDRGRGSLSMGPGVDRQQVIDAGSNRSEAMGGSPLGWLVWG